MRYVFLLNPAAGRQDCTERLRLQAEGALRRAGVLRADWTICRTEYRGHARALAEAAAREGSPVRIFAAGGDGTFNEALTGARPYPNAAVGCIPTGSGNDFLRTFIAPITVYPGEDELLALCQGALRVVTGEEKAKEY